MSTRREKRSSLEFSTQVGKFSVYYVKNAPINTRNYCIFLDAIADICQAKMCIDLSYHLFNGKNLH